MKSSLALALVILTVLAHAQPESQNDTWVNVSFFPTVNFLEYGGAQNIHIRPYGFEVSGSLPSTLVTMSMVPHICTTYAVNESTAYSNRPSDLTYVDIGSDPHEVFCRSEGVSGGLSSTLCDDGDTRPCYVQDVANLSIATIQRYRISRALEFSWFACNKLNSSWYTSSACDTSTTCYNRAPPVRTITPGCETCDWDCEYGIQCFYTTGLPPIWYATDNSLPNDIPCKDPNKCEYYCCSEQKRTGDVTIQYLTQCTFVPVVDPQAPACEGGARLNDAVTGSATVFVDELASPSPVLTAPVVSRYMGGNWSCDFPCTTSETLQISECIIVNGTKLCTPEIFNTETGGYHDKVCSTNFLLVPSAACKDGGTPISFKNIEKSLAFGQDPFYTIEESRAFHQRRVCTESDYLLCDPPVCKCLRPDGCPKHVKCNSHGTYFEDLFDLEDPLDDSIQSPHFNIPVCSCEPDYSGRFCQFKKSEDDADCNKGQSLANENRVVQ